MGNLLRLFEIIYWRENGMETLLFLGGLLAFAVMFVVGFILGVLR